MTADARCPYCQSRGGLDDAVRCPGCGAICHRDCWQDYGGCAVPGCSQAPATPAPAAPALTPPPGWFPDPAGSGRLRWWSGTAWTDHVHPPFGP